MTEKGRKQSLVSTEYEIGGEPLPIDETTFKVEYAKRSNPDGSPWLGLWILTAKDRKVGETYVLQGYATVLLVNDFLFGSLPNPHLLEKLTLFRLPGAVGLSWGRHTAKEVQKALDKHGKLEGSEENEWLVGLAGRINSFSHGVSLSTDSDELGIFRKLSKTDYRIVPPPRGFQRY